MAFDWANTPVATGLTSSHIDPFWNWLFAACFCFSHISFANVCEMLASESFLVCFSVTVFISFIWCTYFAFGSVIVNLVYETIVHAQLVQGCHTGDWSYNFNPPLLDYRLSALPNMHRTLIIFSSCNLWAFFILWSSFSFRVFNAPDQLTVFFKNVSSLCPYVT